MNLDLLLQAAAVPQPPFKQEQMVAESLAQFDWNRHSRKRRICEGEESSNEALSNDEEHPSGLSLLSRSAPERTGKFMGGKKKGLAKDDNSLLTGPQRSDFLFSSPSSSPSASSDAAKQKLLLENLIHATGTPKNHSLDDDDEDEDTPEKHDLRRSCLVDGVPQPMSLEAPPRPLMYEDLINYPRSRGKAHARRCVMCGHLASGEAATCSIPLQNKDVCKRCDTGIWRHRATMEYFKWCKGCKKFLHVYAFKEKLSKCTTKYSKQPSKCDRCRERGRQSYMSKRLDCGSSSGPGNNGLHHLATQAAVSPDAHKASDVFKPESPHDDTPGL